MIVSQYDIYAKDAVLDGLSPPILQFAIRSLFIELLSNNAENLASVEATQRIVIGSQIGDQVVKEHLKLDLLRIYHIVIRSKLKNLIGAKDLSLRKCGTAQKTAGSVRFGFLMG